MVKDKKRNAKVHRIKEPLDVGFGAGHVATSLLLVQGTDKGAMHAKCRSCIEVLYHYVPNPALAPQTYHKSLHRPECSEQLELYLILQHHHDTHQLFG